MTDLEDRPWFSHDQYLEAADLNATVAHASAQRARSTLAGHRPGIALGLELVEVKAPNDTIDLVVQPGFAWDGFGRSIIVAAPVRLSPALFASYDGPHGRVTPVEVWIRYDEALTRPIKPGYRACDGPAFSRVREAYAFEVGPRPDRSSRRDPIEVAGRFMDASLALQTFDRTAAELADGSVPHQVLPEQGSHARWLLPLGIVAYQPGNPGQFVRRDEAMVARHAESRQYVGVVAGSIEAMGGIVRVHDRSKPDLSSNTGELLAVEGAVRTDGDVRLYGASLAFISGQDGAPIQVTRTENEPPGSSQLNVMIGDRPGAGNRFVVGSKIGAQADDSASYEPSLVVVDTGNVGIGLADPKARLDVVGDVNVSGSLRVGGAASVGAVSDVRAVWGAVDPKGSATAGDGFTVRALENGRYRLTFADPFAGPPTLVVTALQGEASGAEAKRAAAPFAAVERIEARHAVVATGAGAGFTFIAMGPR